MDDIEEYQDCSRNAPVLEFARPPTLPIQKNITINWEPNISQEERGEILYSGLMSGTSIGVFNMILCLASPFLYLVDYVWDIINALKFYWAGMMAEFGWTLVFVFLPGFINTAITIGMYSATKRNDKTWRKILLFLILILQMAPLLRAIDALTYACKSRRAARKGNHEANFNNYLAKRYEDKEAAPLRLFECFMEAAPQLTMQITLLLRRTDDFAVFQKVTISLSAAALIPAILMYVRNYLMDLQDIQLSWPRTLQISLGHYLVTLSRVFSIATIACLFPHWTVVMCCIHILTMATCLKLSNQNQVLGVNTIAQIAFSFTFGAVFLFTSILPIKVQKKSWNAAYYSLCFLQNITCCVLWFVYATDEMRQTRLYYLVFGLSIVPYCIGINLMYGSMHCQCSIRSTIHMNDITALSDLAKIKKCVDKKRAAASRRQDDDRAIVTKDDLEVVILNRDKALSEIEATTLRNAIEDKLVDYLPDNLDSYRSTHYPTLTIFPKRVYTGLRLTCADERSMSWLTRTVDFRKDIWEGCGKFRVFPVNRLPRYQIGIIFFTDFTKDVTVIRKLLHFQNGAYEINWWPVFKHDEKVIVGSKEINHVLVFGIPTKDAETLQTNGYRLKFNLTTVRVFLIDELGDRGLMDKPQGIQTDSDDDEAAACSASDKLINAGPAASPVADTANLPKVTYDKPEGKQSHSDNDEAAACSASDKLINAGPAASPVADTANLPKVTYDKPEGKQSHSDNDEAAACSASDKLINAGPAASPVADTANLPKVTYDKPEGKQSHSDNDEAAACSASDKLINAGPAASPVADTANLPKVTYDKHEGKQSHSDNDEAAACSASDKLINAGPAASPVADTANLPKVTAGNSDYSDYDEEQLLLGYLSSGEGKDANLKGLNAARDQRLFVA